MGDNVGAREGVLGSGGRRRGVAGGSAFGGEGSAGPRVEDEADETDVAEGEGRRGGYGTGTECIGSLLDARRSCDDIEVDEVDAEEATEAGAGGYCALRALPALLAVE